MASNGVVKAFSFYRDDEGSAFKRHRGRVPFDIEKHNSMEIARKHLIEFMGIKQQAEKFGLGSFDLKLFRLEKIDGKAENFAVVMKAQLNMELPFLIGSTTSELNGGYLILILENVIYFSAQGSLHRCSLETKASELVVDNSTSHPTSNVNNISVFGKRTQKIVKLKSTTQRKIL